MIKEINELMNNGVMDRGVQAQTMWAGNKVASIQTDEGGTGGSRTRQAMSIAHVRGAEHQV